MAVAYQRTAPARAVRWLAVPIVAGAFIAGVWLVGGVIAGTFRTAMGLTAAWYVGAAVLCAAVARGRAVLRAPIFAGYVVAAVSVGGFLAFSTLHDRVVHERVAVGTPASAATGRAGINVEVAAGAFSSGEHALRYACNACRGRSTAVQVAALGALGAAIGASLLVS